MNQLPSIRRRLFASLLAPLVVLFVVAVAFGYRSAVETARDAFDHGLSDDAMALASRATVRADGVLVFDLPQAAEAILRTDSEDLEFFSVWGPDGRLLAGDADLISGDDVPGDQPRLRDAVIRGHDVRKAEFRFATAGGPVSVVFAETLAKRNNAQNRIFASLVFPNTVLVLLVIALVHFAVSRALAPLSQLTNAIATRSGNGVVPLETEGVDLEVLPLVTALNGLMARLAAAAVAQRRFLADAAHQLRTPLTGLRTQIDLLAADLPPENRERIGTLTTSAERVGHLSQQLLALARSSPEASAGHALETVDLAELVEARAHDWVDLALERNADIGFELAAAPTHGAAWLLEEMLTNLIDNAVKHGGPNITVRTGTGSDGRVFVEVEDDGAGIPASEREAIFDRFYRGRGATETGTGLGLAIVREVADRHGAGIEVGSGPEGRGTVFRLTFEPATAAKPV